MKTNTRAFVWIGGVVCLAAAVLYVPVLIGQIRYQNTAGQIRAYNESLDALSEKDPSALYRAVAQTMIPAVAVVATAERIEADAAEDGGGNDSAPQAPPLPVPPDGRGQPELFQLGVGSGIVADAENGYILTNWHLVADADEVRVILADGRAFNSGWIRTDRRTDLAVIKIEADGLFAAPLGDSSQASVGDVVLAIGAPRGLAHTVTAGIVSAQDRTTGQIYQTYIQSDAAINPGNSGGPLVNMRGEVVGVNTGIVSSAGAFQGIGLAIPSNVAKAVMKQLIEKGEVVRGYIGVQIQDMSGRIAERLGLPNDKGALVVGVEPEGPAAQAGLSPEDVIVRVDGEEIANSYDLQLVVSELEPGRQVPVDIYRGGEKQTVEVEIGTLPDAPE
ncbi:MAG: trypsin-like peptidase domain-containing protein [Phycisphaerae bacterium]|nr:trypsin-like peptidase domain-containing protein [Phycisphaerae bacterium]